jgi:hypothetical protein
VPEVQDQLPGGRSEIRDAGLYRQFPAILQDVKPEKLQQLRRIHLLSPPRILVIAKAGAGVVQVARGRIPWVSSNRERGEQTFHEALVLERRRLPGCIFAWHHVTEIPGLV